MKYLFDIFACLICLTYFGIFVFICLYLSSFVVICRRSSSFVVVRRRRSVGRSVGRSSLVLSAMSIYRKKENDAASKPNRIATNRCALAQGLSPQNTNPIESPPPPPYWDLLDWMLLLRLERSYERMIDHENIQNPDGQIQSSRLGGLVLGLFPHPNKSHYCFVLEKLSSNKY